MSTGFMLSGPCPYHPPVALIAVCNLYVPPDLELYEDPYGLGRQLRAFPGDMTTSCRHSPIGNIPRPCCAMGQFLQPTLGLNYDLPWMHARGALHMPMDQCCFHRLCQGPV